MGSVEVREKREPLTAQTPSPSSERIACRFVLLLQIGFLLMGLLRLSQPFVSAHFERQNQTYDIARHVFHDGWRAILLPKTSFSLPDNLAQPFTSVHLELPFHGLLGWPFFTLFGHARAVVVLVS